MSPGGTVLHVPTRQGERQEERIGARKFRIEDFAGLSIGDAAELIRNEPVEHAVIYSPAGKALYYVCSRPDSPYTVTVPFGKAGLLRGNVFVHNHPRSESFSEADILILVRHGAREVHVYGPERAFRMVAGKGMRRFRSTEDVIARAEVGARYCRELEAAAERFERIAQAGLLTEAEAWAALTHRVVRMMSAVFRFAYEEI